MCPNHERLFDIGRFRRAGNKAAVTEIIKTRLFVSLVHVIHQPIPVKQNNQRLGNKKDRLVAGMLIDPHHTIFQYPKLAPDYSHVRTVQLSGIIQIVGIHRDTRDLRQVRSDRLGIRVHAPTQN